MVEGGPIDVLCGDWLAELTMLILAKTQAKGGAEDCVDRVIAGAPERWWAIAPADLPNALGAAGTRLTKLGKRTMKQIDEKRR